MRVQSTLGDNNRSDRMGITDEMIGLEMIVTAQTARLLAAEYLKTVEQWLTKQTGEVHWPAWGVQASAKAN